MELSSSVPLAFGDALQLFQEVGQLRDVEAVDLADLFLLLGVVAVVRQVVVAVGHADERIGPVAALVGHDERADARQVALEGQGHQVVHQADVLGVVLRNAGRPRIVGQRLIRGALGRFDARFQLADRAEILVELALVLGAEPGVQIVGVFEHEVEHALFELLALGALLGGAAHGKQPLEDQLGVDFLGLGRALGAPGDVGRVGAAIARVAVAGLRAAIAAQLERGKLRLAADLCAATWSTETPTLISAPCVLRACCPVRKLDRARAWSPAPSPWGRP